MPTRKHSDKDVRYGPTPLLKSVEVTSRELICHLKDGREFRASFRKLLIPTRPRIVGAALSEERIAAVLRREDGSSYAVAVDYVIHVNSPHHDATREDAARVALKRRISQRLKALRLARGVTMEWVARRMGIATPNYARMESGRHMHQLDVLWKAAQALGETLDFFVAMKARPAKRMAKRALAAPRDDVQAYGP